MSKTVADDYLRRIPKAELHCHLAGTLRATTVADLARRAGLALPRPPEQLYQWPDFYGFLDVLRLTALCLRTPEDFARAVYEYVEDAGADGNLRHVEFFFNPDYFYPNGIDYPAMVDGMIEGIEAAKKQFGVSCLLIACIDRSHRTAHCCEDNQTLVEAPPTNYLICRDVLGCDRIDHGYNMLASDFVMAEARRDGLYFTPCAWTSLVHNRPHRPQRIRRMVEAGLNVTINTDDPAMFQTDLGHGYTTLFESIGWGPDMARKFSLNSVEGSWLDESDKSALRIAFRREIAALDKEFGYETAAPSV